MYYNEISLNNPFEKQYQQKKWPPARVATFLVTRKYSIISHNLW